MSPRGGVNRHLKLILQIKALNTIVSNKPVRPVKAVLGLETGFKHSDRSDRLSRLVRPVLRRTCTKVLILPFYEL